MEGEDDEDEDDNDDDDDDDDELLDNNLEPMEDAASDDVEGEFDDALCCICKVNRNNSAFFPCCHYCICFECSTIYRENYTRCPMCRLEYVDIKKMY